jgi:hypothetical protein
MLAQSANGIDVEEHSRSEEFVEPRVAPLRSVQDDHRDLDLVDLRHDLEVVLPRLPSQLRVVWDWLQSDTVRRTARALRVSPMTIYLRIKQLRAAFTGIDSQKSFQKDETLRS